MTLAPVHTIRALVVHLHGDHLEPLSMTNTLEELDEYESPVDKFLDQVLTDYGFVAVGWSAAYDPAMRQAITPNTTRVFTGYFINPGKIEPVANDLIAHRGMTRVKATADDSIGHLSDSVTALKQRRARHPLSVTAAVETAKRQLSGNHVAISLHDSIKHEINHVRELPELDPSAQRGGGTITDARAAVTKHSMVAAGLVAAAAYWGDNTADTWWRGELSTFAVRPHIDGSLNWLDLPKLPGALLFHAAGVASTASGRYDLTQLLVGLSVVNEKGETEPISGLLAPSPGFTGGDKPSFVIFPALKEIFVNDLALGQRGYEAAWEEFEFLRMVAATSPARCADKGSECSDYAVSTPTRSLRGRTFDVRIAHRTEHHRRRQGAETQLQRLYNRRRMNSTNSSRSEIHTFGA